jgi:hypothetical protein
MNTGRHDDEFDRAMRALHRDAVAHVGPQVRRRLRSARQQAGADPRRSRFGWPIAGALAAALVLAIALPLRTPDSAQPPATATRADRARLPAAPIDAPIEPTALVALDESPEFYLWLASNDAGPAGALP